MNTATILSAYVSAFTAFVEKKNAKAAKLNVPSIQFSISKPYLKEVKDANDETLSLEFVDLTIDESPIKLNGWNVVGRIDDLEGMPVISAYSESDMKKYRSYSMTQCDHCNINRKRNHLVIVQNNEGTTKAIGSTCLSDFTGHVSALQYTSMLSWTFNLQESLDEEGFTSTSGVKQVYSLNRVLAFGAAVIRENRGYVSVSYANDNGVCSTKDAVIYTMTSKKVEIEITPEDEAYAEKVMKYVSETDLGDSEFIYNLKTVFSCENIPMRHVGIALAAFPTYARQFAKTESVPSEFMGQVGSKIITEVIVENAIAIPGQYGVTIMYVMKSDSNRIVWFSSGSASLNLGVKYRISATVKKHEVFRGNNQTIITRAKVLA